MSKLTILLFLVISGFALVNVSRDYFHAVDKKKWIRGAVWWLAMYTMLMGPLFATLYLLFTFG